MLAAALLAAAPAASLGGDDTRATWVEAHRPVRVAVERDYGPFVFEANGEPHGLSIDLLMLVARHEGLRLTFLPPQPLHELLAAAQRDEVDLVTSLRPTAERETYLSFTAPYVRVPAVVVSRAPALGALAALAGHRVAVGQSFAIEAYLRARAPAIQWVPVVDDAQALRELAAGQVDAVVADLASVNYQRRRLHLDGLVIGQPVGFDYTLSFAVRRELGALRELLDEGMRTIGPEDRERLRATWMPAAPGLPGTQVRSRTVTLGLVLLVLALLGGAAAWWHGRRAAARGAKDRR